jgi:hypothetical protein
MTRSAAFAGLALAAAACGNSGGSIWGAGGSGAAADGGAGSSSSGSPAASSGGSGAMGGASSGGTTGGASSGASGSSGAGGSSGTAGGTGSNGTTPPPPFSAVQSYSYVRKVKDLLTGLAPTAAEVAAATDAGQLATLIDGWIATPQFQDKMLVFFRDVFQQSQFAVADFAFQLRTRPGAFELPYGIYGDTAFPMMFKNMQESVARTALYYAENGLPLTNILTAKQFMMTTGLMSLYLQIEMPYDIHTFSFNFNQGSRPALADTLDPASANYLTFGYAAPTTVFEDRFAKSGCQGQNIVSTYMGNTTLYHLLLGVVDRDVPGKSSATTNSGCMEHAIQPYITPADQSDWRLVTLRPLNAGEAQLVSYDLPSLRGIASGGSLGVHAQRVGFFSTPAFLAVWNTNDSNQHRVTANQALLAALGEGFTSTSVVIPPQQVSTTGLDPAHAVSGSVCYSCHVSLDPMRQFWGNPFDFNDVPVATPKTTGGVFAFANVNATGTSLVDLGGDLSQVTDTDPTTNAAVSRFAWNMAQQFCYFADSAPCSTDDPVFRTVVSDFQASHFDVKTLVRELFSSALVTSASDTKTFADRGVVVSIARREQYCTAIANRLNLPDICNIGTPSPNGTDVKDRAFDITRLAGSISVDSFSRGAQGPVTPSDPNLFFRAAVELVCENLASKVVDATGGPYKSTSATTVAAAVEDMVTKLLAYPPADATNAADPNHAQAASILQTHYTSAVSGGATATNALRSTFVAACESPTAVSIGL